jgi:hypothetical protein
MKSMLPAMFLILLIATATRGQTPYTTGFAVGDLAAYRYSELDQQGAIIRTTVAVRRLRAAPPLLNRDAVIDTAEVTSIQGSLFTFPGLQTFFKKNRLRMAVPPGGMPRTFYFSGRVRRRLVPPPPAGIGHAFDRHGDGHGDGTFRYDGVRACGAGFPSPHWRQYGLSSAHHRR